MQKINLRIKNENGSWGPTFSRIIFVDAFISNDDNNNCDCGDVNCDGEVNSQDAALILQYIVGLTDLESYGLVSGDVNNNSSINSQDAALILQYVVGLIAELTCE